MRWRNNFCQRQDKRYSVSVWSQAICIQLPFPVKFIVYEVLYLMRVLLEYKILKLFLWVKIGLLLLLCLRGMGMPQATLKTCQPIVMIIYTSYISVIQKNYFANIPDMEPLLTSPGARPPLNFRITFKTYPVLLDFWIIFRNQWLYFVMLQLELLYYF